MLEAAAEDLREANRLRGAEEEEAANKLSSSSRNNCRNIQESYYDSK